MMRVGLNFNKPAFGYMQSIDLGMSDPRITVKSDCILEETHGAYERGTSIIARNGFINPDSRPIHTENDFINLLARKIENVQRETVSKLEYMGIEEEKEGKLSRLALFLPGHIVNNSVVLTNLKKSDGATLGVSIDKIEEELNLSGNVRGVTDSVGTGLAVLEMLTNDPEYQDMVSEPDFRATVVITGGGCGTANIQKNLSGDNFTVDGQGSAYTGSMSKFSSDGASVGASIKNWAKAMEVNDPEDLVASGNGKIITDEEEARKVLSFEFSSEEFQYARTEAINKYAAALATIAVQKINTRYDILVITGPFALGINETIRQNSEQFKGAKSLPELIDKQLRSYIGKDPVTEALYPRFKIICDERFAVSDNTAGGRILLDDRVEVIGDKCFVSVPVEVLGV